MTISLFCFSRVKGTFDDGCLASVAVAWRGQAPALPLDSYNGKRVNLTETRPWSRLSNFLCYGSFKAADPIGVDPATKAEAKTGAQPIDSVVYLDSVDAVKAPVARADELDPIDLLEATK